MTVAETVNKLNADLHAIIQNLVETKKELDTAIRQNTKDWQNTITEAGLKVSYLNSQLKSAQLNTIEWFFISLLIAIPSFACGITATIFWRAFT